MDGVITDTEPLHQEAEAYACKTHGISIPHTEWKKFKGRTNNDIFSYIVENFTNGDISVDTLILAKKTRYMEIAQERMVLVRGALDFIRHARDRFSKLALVTSSGREIAELVFQKYRLRQYFDTVVTGDDITNGKPHPEPYLLALEKLGSDPGLAWVIEDSTNGIMSAGHAGCRVIGITTSFPRSLLEKSGAEIVVDSFSELYALV
jgi:HAD superfamily hydrolase (TIGR01509 family)